MEICNNFFMKKVFTPSIIMGILMLIIASFVGCQSYSVTYQEAFMSNWGIELPQNLTEEFNESERHPRGEGIRYAVFKTDETDEVMAVFLADFSREKSIEFENRVEDSFKLASFAIPEDHLPDWSVEYYWRHIGKHLVDIFETETYHDNLYMVYFPETNLLKICQNFG